MGAFLSPPNPVFFKVKNLWAYNYTLYGTSIHFKNINLQYFAIFLDNNF